MESRDRMRVGARTSSRSTRPHTAFSGFAGSGHPGARTAVLISVLFAAIGPWSQTARAGNDIYFVTYNHHIDAGEAELMQMIDVTEPAERGERVGSYLSWMPELEFGVTEQWATELMLEGFFDFTHTFGRFTGFRWENRYRLQKARNRGLNPVLYMEYEDLDPTTRFRMEVSGREDGKGEPRELEGKRERILETRLILSRDFGPWNLAFDWINETDTRRDGFTDFGYATGIRRNMAGHHHGADKEAPGAPSSLGGGFHCPMHPEQSADQVSRCPVCGMEMVSDATTRGERQADPPGGLRLAAFGVELFGGIGNSGAFGGPVRVQQHYLSPILMLHPRERMMIHVAAAFGLTGVSDDFLRIGLAWEL